MLGPSTPLFVPFHSCQFSAKKDYFHGRNSNKSKAAFVIMYFLLKTFKVSKCIQLSKRFHLAAISYENCGRMMVFLVMFRESHGRQKGFHLAKIQCGQIVEQW
jgi:hypothetical protein